MGDSRSDPGAAASPTVARFLAAFDRRGVDAEVHPGDAMFRFAERLAHGVREAALLEYFRSGYGAARVAEALLGWRFGDGTDPSSGPRSILEFGSGHGRVTRFLAPRYGGGRITAAEVDPTAVGFVRRFGVAAVATTTDPGAFDPGRRFDAILAFSVLSHLPEGTFRRWLERWWHHLEPGGVLVASVLDRRVMLPGRTFPASGFWFEPMSESEVLDAADYGTTWVSEEYLRGLLAALPGVAAAHRIPLGLWHLQDLWAVVKEPGGELPAPAFDPGPCGYLESCTLDADRRRLEVTGWAKAAVGGTTVELRVADGTDHEAVVAGAPTDRRDDLPPEHATADATGFRLVHDAPAPIDPATPICVEARDGATGSRHLLHLGTAEATDLFLRLRAARREADRLREAVEVFEASGFGRLRRRWMGWKRRYAILTPSPRPDPPQT